MYKEQSLAVLNNVYFKIYNRWLRCRFLSLLYLIIVTSASLYVGWGSRMLQDLIARCDILETTIPFGVCTFWSFSSLEYQIPIMCPEWKKWMVIETAMKKVCNRLYVDTKIPQILHYVKLHYSRFIMKLHILD